MITLRNGYKFKYCCASGAFGFNGKPYLWERPFIDLSKITIITKTLTFFPRQGDFQWWKFWETFRINSQYTINALGLPNPSLYFWIRDGYKPELIPSVCPFNKTEAMLMSYALNDLDIPAVELNISCPNIDDNIDPIEIIRVMLRVCKHPLIVKIGALDDYIMICDTFGNQIVIDAINSIPWYSIYAKISPLYPLEGGVSSRETAKIARDILEDITTRYPDIQVISGNGIYDYDEAVERFKRKAGAISFGTVYRLTPWRPDRIITQLENNHIG